MGTLLSQLNLVSVEMFYVQSDNQTDHILSPCTYRQVSMGAMTAVLQANKLIQVQLGGIM